MSSSDSRGERSIEDILAAIRTGKPLEDIAPGTGAQVSAPSGPSETPQRTSTPPHSSEPQLPSYMPPAARVAPHDVRSDPTLSNPSAGGLPPLGARTGGRPAPLTGRLAEVFGAVVAKPQPGPAPVSTDDMSATSALDPAQASVRTGQSLDDDLSDLLGEPVMPERAVSARLAAPAAPAAEPTARSPVFGTAFAPAGNVRGHRDAGPEEPSGATQPAAVQAFDFSTMVPTREPTTGAPGVPAEDQSLTVTDTAAAPPAPEPAKPRDDQPVATRPAPVVIAAMPRASTVVPAEAAAPAAETMRRPAGEAGDPGTAAASTSRALDDHNPAQAAEATAAPAPAVNRPSSNAATALKPIVNGNHAKTPAAPARTQPTAVPLSGTVNGSGVAKAGKDPVSDLRAHPITPSAETSSPAPQAGPATVATSPATGGPVRTTDVAVQSTTLIRPAISEIDGGLQRVRTMEDTVAELLRPMLREWLDANMPRIVEKALRVELAESVRKKLDGGGKG
ncbi:MAG: DUF2497 domain-containing protein [Hyphomicrobiaceae bacterium]|nr:DUF2497 domain-containing protein [Hyphomicrobiaceae bacterium]